MKYLICHVTSRKHMIEGSGNFMSGTSSWNVTTLSNLVATGIAVVEVFSLSRDQVRPRD